MSGKRAKATRRADRERPEIDRNAEYAKAAAKRVLAVDFSGVPATRVTQFVLGWVRAAFDQSRVIATLMQAGLAPGAAPNRRSFAELVVRLQWLHAMEKGERAGALDAMLDHERELTVKALDHVREMGFEPQRDLARMQDFVLKAADGPVKDQARRFLAAAQSTDGQSVGMYYAWREETQYSHASGALASAYAPVTFADPFPPVADANLTAHVYALFLVVTLAYHLLVEEGVEADAAMMILDAYLGLN